MKFSFIAEDVAPVAAIKPSAKAQAILDMLNGIEDGRVAAITPDDKMSLKGIATGVGRISKAHNIDIETWQVDGVYYVKRVAQDQATA
jgi:hypothetical protein